MAERIAEENLSNLFKSFKNPLACISIVYDLLDLGGFVGFLAVRRLNIILTHPLRDMPLIRMAFSIARSAVFPKLGEFGFFQRDRIHINAVV